MPTYRFVPLQRLAGISNSDVLKGIHDAIKMFDPYNVDWKYVSSGAADLYILIYDVPNNQRGVAVPWGRQGGAYPWPGVYLDASDRRTWTPDIVRRVVAHEILHMYGVGHSNDTNCIMHSNVSAKTWCPAEDRWLASKWGRRQAPTPPPEEQGIKELHWFVADNVARWKFQIRKAGNMQFIYYNDVLGTYPVKAGTYEYKLNVSHPGTYKFALRLGNVITRSHTTR